MEHALYKLETQRNVQVDFYFPEIDAYHAIKLYSVKFRGVITSTHNAVTVAEISITVDEQVGVGFDAAKTIFAGFKTGSKYLVSEIVANTIHHTYVTLPVSEKWDMYGGICGDFVQVYLYSSNAGCTFTGFLTVAYDVIETSFDQYGQCEKTMRRLT